MLHHLQLLPKASFDCVEEIARVLSHSPSDSTLKKLMKEAKTAKDPWARRNGLRVLGEFCWTISNCRSVDGVGCSLIPGCKEILKGKYRKEFKAVLEKRIAEETHEKPLDDALWIAGAFFKPIVGAHSAFNLSVTRNPRNKEGVIVGGDQLGFGPHFGGPKIRQAKPHA